MTTILGWSIEREPRRHYVTAFRFYGAREVRQTAQGLRPARADSWRLVREVKVRSRRGRLTVPDFELEPTDELNGSGIRLYKVAAVYEGRELEAGPDAELLLPSDLGDRIDFVFLLLWNLERLGIIAPGQLND